MHRLHLAVPALALAAAATPAFAQSFGYELLVSRDQAAGGVAADRLQRLTGFGSFGGETFAFLRQPNAANGVLSSGQPGQTFDVDLNGLELQSDGFDGNGLALVGQIPSNAFGLIFPDQETLSILAYTPPTAPDADPIDGAEGLTRLLRTADITGVTGQTSVGLGEGQVTLADGSLVFYESVSDRLLRNDGTAGNLTTFLGEADLLAPLQAADPSVTNVVLSGLAVAGDRLLVAAESGDLILSYDLTASDLAGSATVLLSKSDITAKTGDDSAGFRGGIVTGGDGLVYFYDTSSDSVLRFNPANPASLRVLLTDDQLDAGLGTDVLAGIVATDTGAAFYTARGTATDGLYAIVPEPAGLLGLAAVGVPALLRRRRR